MFSKILIHDQRKMDVDIKLQQLEQDRQTLERLQKNANNAAQELEAEIQRQEKSRSAYTKRLQEEWIEKLAVLRARREMKKYNHMIPFLEEELKEHPHMQVRIKLYRAARRYVLSQMNRSSTMIDMLQITPNLVPRGDAEVNLGHRLSQINDDDLKDYIEARYKVDVTVKREERFFEDLDGYRGVEIHRVLVDSNRGLNK